MDLQITYPHLEKPQGQPARLQRLPRVSVAQIVMDQLAHGWSVDEMCRQHAYLNPAEAHAAMAYYFDHQEEIDQIQSDWNACNEAKQHGSRSPFASRMQ